MRFTRFGMLTRAVSEREKGVVLLGYSPAVVGAANWALATMLAAVAGILIAPITSLSLHDVHAPDRAGARGRPRRGVPFVHAGGRRRRAARDRSVRAHPLPGGSAVVAPAPGTPGSAAVRRDHHRDDARREPRPRRGELVDQRLPAVGRGGPRPVGALLAVAGVVVAVGSSTARTRVRSRPRCSRRSSCCCSSS